MLSLLQRNITKARPAPSTTGSPGSDPMFARKLLAFFQALLDLLCTRRTRRF